jgi:5-methyltetrahydropteroyltriglutamate--homocysteine methyltransferase
MIGRNRLHKLREQALHSTIQELEKTESKVISDGEQGKPSFLTYPIYALADEYYTFSSNCFSLTFSDGHQRSLPLLCKAPFRYATYAHTYVDEAKKHTNLPIK